MSSSAPGPPLLPISASWLALAFLLFMGWLIYLLAPILTPFTMAALLAYMGDPLADQLEARGFSRTVSVVMVFTAMILMIIFFILLVVPMLSEQVSRLIQRLPEYLHWAQERIHALAIRCLVRILGWWLCWTAAPGGLDGQQDHRGPSRTLAKGRGDGCPGTRVLGSHSRIGGG